MSQVDDISVEKSDDPNACPLMAHPPEHRTEVRRLTMWGLAANLVLAAAKFVCGVFGASQALVADAVHSLSDSATDILILVGSSYWTAPPDDDHPYGHGRIETIITAVIGAILLVGAGALVYSSLASIQVPRERLPGWIVLVAALASVAIKEGLYRWTVSVGQRVRSSSLIANAWHHRSDGLSSLPVALAALGSKIRPEWAFLDAVAAVVVSLLIGQAAWKILWPALRQLSDIGASEHERQHVESVALATEGVKSVHAVRTRHIGPGLQVDLHVLVDPLLSVREGHMIATVVKSRLLAEGPNVVDVLIHLEPHEHPHTLGPESARS